MRVMGAILAACVAICGPANAACNIELAPASYDRPLTYKPFIIVLDYWYVNQFCTQLGGLPAFADTGRLEACTKGHLMILPRVGTGNITGEEQECDYHHERSHMPGNDWPANHPGAFWGSTQHDEDWAITLEL